MGAWNAGVPGSAMGDEGGNRVAVTPLLTGRTFSTFRSRANYFTSGRTLEKPPSIAHT